MKCYELFEAGKYRAAYLEFIELYEDTGNKEFLQMAAKSGTRGNVDKQEVTQFFADRITEIDEKKTLFSLAGYFSDEELYKELRDEIGHEIIEIVEKIESKEKYDLDALSFLETHYKFKMINTVDSERVGNYVSSLIKAFSKIGNQSTESFVKIRERLYQHFYLEEGQDALDLAKNEATGFDEVVKEKIKLLKALESIQEENSAGLNLLRTSEVVDNDIVHLIDYFKGIKDEPRGKYSEIAERIEDESSQVNFLTTYISETLGILLVPKLIWNGENLSNEGESLVILEDGETISPGEIYRPSESENLELDFMTTFGRKNITLTNPMREDSPTQLYVEDIDSFEQVREVERSEIKSDRTEVYEDRIKDVIRDILDEPFDQNDWGGEINDLYTSAVKNNGERLDTAFMLKGKGKQGELHIADAGSRGTQIQRLFDADADLYVVQYVGKINDRTQREIKEKAQHHNARYYCIIDGTDTARLIEAYD